ncbi:MAG: hypothetical protein U5K84_06035 [Alkalibacterium sp.]|nr:hypothetical protein [Alkalibacterium sp.]
MYNIYQKMASLDKKNRKDADLKLVVLLKDYLGKDWQKYEEQFAVKKYVTDAFPPTRIMTAHYDFLKIRSTGRWLKG